VSPARDTTQSTFLPTPCIDLGATLDGGQSFRWWAECGGYRGVVGRRVLRLSAAPGGVCMEAPGGEDASAVVTTVRDYLGLDDDLDALLARHAADPAATGAMRAWPGLRLLQQEPWECLVGFICSANSSIQKIKKDMSAISGAFGEHVGPGEWDYAFPSPSRLAKKGEDALREVGLGFRAKYVAAAAEAITTGRVELESLRTTPYLHARAVLMTLPGVGEKIADCVLAFSLGKREAFPVDRWVRKAVRNRYGVLPTMSDGAIGEWARQRFGQDATYVNQYLFHQERLKDSRSRGAAAR